MGMFDEVRIMVPLPDIGKSDLMFQTKDTPDQFMDLYEIREDGTLWHEDYDVEDQSDPKAEGLAGLMTRVNTRWVQVEFCGELRLTNYNSDSKVFMEFSAYFVEGKLNQIHRIHH